MEKIKEENDKEYAQNEVNRIRQEAQNEAKKIKQEAYNEAKRIKKTAEDEVEQMKEKALMNGGGNKPEESPIEPTPIINAHPPQFSPLFGLYPDGENGFLEASLNDDGSDNYYFVIKRQSLTNATFSLVDDPELQKDAAKGANTILQSACKYLNTPMETRTGIKTEEEGLLEKSGNEWKIKQKAKIRFV